MTDTVDYVYLAYNGAVWALLYSETGGCNSDCGMWGETDSCGDPRCDRAYDLHGYDAEAVDMCWELHDAIRDMYSEFVEDVIREDISPEDFGNYFIMSANGHGVGFWDSDLVSDSHLGRRMTDWARKYEGTTLYGEETLYVEMGR